MAEQIYTSYPLSVDNLLMYVETGHTGLPDLQRPFVWKDSKVRDLLDSMLKGFPIGFIMLWESPMGYKKGSHIGENEKSIKEPKSLVVDGQQRLTALLAAIRGHEIVDKNFKKRHIKISFNPLKREVAVWTKAYDKSSEWISVISDVFSAEKEHRIPSLRKAYIEKLNEIREREGQEALNDEEESVIENNINDLLNLKSYSLPTLEIRQSADEEDVAEIFVRVNSGGQQLTEKNFIETLLAVYDNDIHKQINQFCEESRIPVDGTAYNNIIKVDPVHIIRAAVGVAFHRARLKYAYMLLRGKDLETGKYDEEIQKKNLSAFREAVEMVKNLYDWHAFLNIVSEAGYLSESLISSNNAIVFAYIFYLIGKNTYKVAVNELGKLIRRFFFVAIIRGYFTGSSSESAAERIFADLRNVSKAEDFVEYFNRIMQNEFTEDYFNHNLINELETSSTSSPIWHGYLASMNVLNCTMLFSTTPLSKYFLLGASGTNSSIDIHHIFPKNYLTSLGIEDDRIRNQIANYTYIGKGENIVISDDAPKEYVSKWRNEHGEEEYKKACKANALPYNFENLDYDTFLQERRRLMAKLIREAYDKLSK